MYEWGETSPDCPASLPVPGGGGRSGGRLVRPRAERSTFEHRAAGGMPGLPVMTGITPVTNGVNVTWDGPSGYYQLFETAELGSSRLGGCGQRHELGPHRHRYRPFQQCFLSSRRAIAQIRRVPGLRRMPRTHSEHGDAYPPCGRVHQRAVRGGRGPNQRLVCGLPRGGIRFANGICQPDQTPRTWPACNARTATVRRPIMRPILMILPSGRAPKWPRRSAADVIPMHAIRPSMNGRPAAMRTWWQT